MRCRQCWCGLVCRLVSALLGSHAAGWVVVRGAIRFSCSWAGLGGVSDASHLAGSSHRDHITSWRGLLDGRCMMVRVCCGLVPCTAYLRRVFRRGAIFGSVANPDRINSGLAGLALD
eukprot:3847953-Prymnesium_polylepis.1